MNRMNAEKGVWHCEGGTYKLFYKKFNCYITKQEEPDIEEMTYRIRITELWNVEVVDFAPTLEEAKNYVEVFLAGRELDR